MAAPFKPVANAETWAIVEVMGHQSYAGTVREVELCGAKFLQVTVPAGEYNEEFAITLSPASLFRVRETTEEAARKYDSNIPEEYRCELRRTPMRAGAGEHLPHWPSAGNVEIYGECAECSSGTAHSVLESFGGICSTCANRSDRDDA